MLSMYIFYSAIYNDLLSFYVFCFQLGFNFDVLLTQSVDESTSESADNTGTPICFYDSRIFSYSVLFTLAALEMPAISVLHFLRILKTYVYFYMFLRVSR